MLTTFDRHLIRDLIGHGLLVITTLALIVLINGGVRLLGRASRGEIAADTVLGLLMLKSITIVVLAMPLAIYLGALITFGRLNRDSEMTVLAAAGVGPSRLLPPLLAAVIPLSIAVGWLTLHLLPWSSAYYHQARFEAEQSALTTGLAAGRFLSRDGITVYVERLDSATQRIEGVHLFAITPDRLLFERAASGALQQNRYGEWEIQLQAGSLYELDQMSGAISTTHFEQQWLTIESGSPPRARLEDVPSAALRDAGDSASRAELEWRMAIPISCLLLGLIALPLSRSAPREGRYARLLPGLLLYLLYIQGLGIAKEWTTEGQDPFGSGLWWVHGAALSVLLTVWFAPWRAVRPLSIRSNVHAHQSER